MLSFSGLKSHHQCGLDVNILKAGLWTVNEQYYDFINSTLYKKKKTAGSD